MSSAVSTAELVPALEGRGVPLATDAAATYAIAGAQPLAVASPTTVEELSAALAAASELGAAVVPWGGGTRQGLGAPPSRYHLALDMRGLDRVLAHEPADLTVTVQAGCTVGALQAALARAGQWLPVDPPLPDRATVGGTLAAGIAGPLSAGFGLPREMVIGMRAVLPDGTVVKSGGNVVKNVTGFAMDRLHVGGLGTLGVIAEVTFKIVPVPRKEATVVAGFPTPHTAAEAYNAAAANGLPIIAAEALAPGNTQDAAGVHVAGWALLLRVAGRPSAVERAVEASSASCREHGAKLGEPAEDDVSAALWDRVADLGWLGAPPAITMRIAVPPAQGPAAAEALGPHGTGALIALNVPRGVVRWADPSGGLDTAAGAAVAMVKGNGAELREQVAAMGGSLVVEGWDRSHGLDPWGPPGDAFEVMRGLKEQYDPRGILNPGRYVGGL